MTDAERQLLISVAEFIAAYSTNIKPEGDRVREALRAVKAEFRSTTSEGVKNYRHNKLDGLIEQH